MSRYLRTLVLAVALCVPLVGASTASATPPVVELGPFQGFTDATLCGFPIGVSFEGTVRTTTFLDRNGNPVRVLQTFPNITVTFTHGSKSLSTKGPAPVTVRLDAAGSVETVTIVGMSANITIPGQGRLLFDVGRIVWDANGNIISEEGLHQVFGTAERSAFCAYMA
jgi:hypothetical protein